MIPKSIFRSKTALLGLITASAGAFSFISDGTRDWLASHAPAVLIVVGSASIALRKFTHGRVTLFPE